MAEVSLPLGCATAFMAVLLSEKRRLGIPSAPAATVAAALPQKLRRLSLGMTDSLAIPVWLRACLQRRTTRLELQCAREFPSIAQWLIDLHVGKDHRNAHMAS
jgi:hypothetical protein